MKFLFSLLLLFFAYTVNAQLSKSEITKNIKTWQAENAEKYHLKLEGKQASATITRYHPERPQEKNDLIEVFYKGMKVQLKFAKPLEEISTHKDSLQKYFSYVSFSKIYNNISSDGWNIYPETPSSSLRAKGVKFISEGETLSFSIHWAVYAITGYKNSKKCNEELAIQDSSAPEECFVHVTKNIPLEVLITGISF
jgi:hypothetical protein